MGHVNPLVMTFLVFLGLTFQVGLACSQGTVPPQEIFNIAHLSFPKDRLAAWNLNQLSQRYSISSDYTCSSLIGPQCATPETLELMEVLGDDAEEDGKIV